MAFNFSPTSYTAKSLDFSALANLPEDFWKGQAVGRQNALRSVLSSDEAKQALASGDYGRIAGLIAPYDSDLAVKLGISANTRGLDRERFAETQRHNVAMENKTSGNNRSYVTSVPDQYGVPQPKIFDRETKTLSDIPGAGTRYRPLSDAQINKFTDEGNKFSALRDFGNSFQDSYGGANVLGIDYGNAEKTVGQLGIGTENATHAAEWWQQYDRNKNTVRKELFGTALTPTEQREFERADIRPGMDPAVIRANLATQTTIVSRAVKRRTDAYKKAGVNPEVIDSAYGLDTSTMQDKPLPTPGQSGVSAAPPQNRVKGQTYQTPKGPMTWTGTGWVPAQ